MAARWLPLVLLRLPAARRHFGARRTTARDGGAEQSNCTSIPSCVNVGFISSDDKLLSLGGLRRDRPNIGI